MQHLLIVHRSWIASTRDRCVSRNAERATSQCDGRLSLRTFLVCALLFGWLPSTLQAADEAIDYLRDVKPLLQTRCYACHGALKQQAGLRLDTAASVLRGGESGASVKAGDPAASLIMQRVTASDLSQRMPPEHEGEPLNAEQVEVLRRWISNGAKGPPSEEPERDPREHWAFRPRVRPAVPADASLAWTRGPIDAFVSQGHRQNQLEPRPEASRLLLVRRLFLDLIGLPPSIEDLAESTADTSPDWYERLSDRLLADPRHGERWARHWMDVWRYSDWWGLGDQLRNSQKHIWHWRDWIIESLNADLPYDEMVRLMLSADETHPNDLPTLRATGFLARNYFLFNRHQWMDETVEHIGKALMGLTLNCSKCHDHKYDPIAQEDYYRLRAFFEPYHARLDILPGVGDIARDGIPRVFDGLPDEPTYRLIRGQETNPDKSRALQPGVPPLLAFAAMEIRPVSLPIEAWRPERRDWIIADQMENAKRKRHAAEESLGQAKAKQATVDATASGSPGQLELRVWELQLEVARAEEISVERRAAAARSQWMLDDAISAMPPATEERRAQLERDAQQLALEASRAERFIAVTVARKTLAETELKQLRARLEAEAKRVEPKKEGDQANPSDQEAKLAALREQQGKELEKLREALAAAEKQFETPDGKFAPFIGAAWTPTRFFNSTADDPQVTFKPTSTGRRSALARWLTDPRHPLPARVAANHLWLRHWGAPLVPTVFDFGRKGQPPVHRELLDWLASELVDHGWSMKRLHREFVVSATYRISSEDAQPDARESRIDPENRWWWRRTPVRLESQVIRDQLLALSGQMDNIRGGPPVPADQQGASRRRSLYFFHSNNERNLWLTTFDEALVKECYRREQSIVPQQALALTNSQLVLRAAPLVARQLERDAPAVAGGNSDKIDTAFVHTAFRSILGTDPGTDELRASLDAITAWRQQPNESPASAHDHFIWVLLNHNDFVTLR
ncbi:MAG: hypothetical protein RIS70_3696 [Planctomycetota bacterium]